MTAQTKAFIRKPRKISDKQFLACLRECGGLYSRTVRMIKDEFGIEMSRQNVFQRAKQFPDELKDIREQNIDIAEEGLHSLMRSKHAPTRLKAIELFLKTIGRDRGYSELLHMNVTHEVLPPRIILNTANIKEAEQIIESRKPKQLSPKSKHHGTRKQSR